MRTVDRLAVAVPGHEPDDLDTRVTVEQPNELASRVAGGADDRDPDTLVRQALRRSGGGVVRAEVEESHAPTIVALG